MESTPDHVPSELVIPFDFRQDPRLRTDPYGFFHSANELPEIFYSPDLGGYWVLARAALIEGAPVRRSAPALRPPALEEADSRIGAPSRPLRGKRAVHTAEEAQVSEARAVERHCTSAD